MSVNNNYKYIYKQRLARRFKKISSSIRHPFKKTNKKKVKHSISVSKTVRPESLRQGYNIRLAISASATVLFFILLAFLLGSSNNNLSKIMDELDLAAVPYPVDNHINEYLEFLHYGVGGDDGVDVDAKFAKQLKTKEHTVKKGETLSEIALSNKLDIGTLISYNNIADVRRIREGMVIKIPDRDGVLHEVRRGDNLENIAKKYGGNFISMLDANDIQSDKIHPGQIVFVPDGKMPEYDLKRATGKLFIYPTVGRRTSPYGYRKDPFTGQLRMHYGLDLANKTGTPVVASMEGSVTYVGILERGFGNYVLISHSNGYQTVYAHLNTISVKNGQWVKQGQEIGKMGSTGRSTGSHLHFGIYKNNIPVDPEGYLSK